MVRLSGRPPALVESSHPDRRRERKKGPANGDHCEIPSPPSSLSLSRHCPSAPRVSPAGNVPNRSAGVTTYSILDDTASNTNGTFNVAASRGRVHPGAHADYKDLIRGLWGLRRRSAPQSRHVLIGPSGSQVRKVVAGGARVVARGAKGGSERWSQVGHRGARFYDL